MISGAWATQLEHVTGMTVRVVPEGGTVLRFRWLRNGIIDMFTDSFSIAKHLECYRPEQRVPDGGPFRARMVFGGSISAWGFAVRGDDEKLKTIYDIDEKTKVAMFPPPSDMTFGLLYWLGLNDGPVLEDPKQGEWKPTIVPFSEAPAWWRSVAEGKCDIVTGTATAPPLIEQAAGRHGLRFLELPYDEDPEGAKKFQNLFTVMMWGKAPEVGVKEMWGIRTLLLGSTLYARDDMPDDLAYNIIKWFDENYDSFKDKAPTLDQYTLKTTRQIIDVTPNPVHPGTIRYLKEKGMWTAKDDLLQEYNIRLQEGYIKLWNIARDQASKQNIKVAADSQEFTDLWYNLKIEKKIPRYRTLQSEEEIKEKLAFLDQIGF